MATATWTGAAGGTGLNDAGNWSDDSVPGHGDTVVFTGNATVSGQLNPSVISVAANAHVTFDKGGNPNTSTYAAAALDIGSFATVSFVGSNLVAETVSNSGVLDLSSATPIASERQNPVQWSENNGFGRVPLVALIGTEKFDLTPLSPTIKSPSGQVKWVISGVNDLGDNNAAVGATPQWFAVDSSSYVSIPSFSGSGRVYDAVGGLLGGSVLGNWAPGFAGTDSPYSAAFAAATTSGLPCFCSGTPVLTGRGYVPVESLRPGDSVLTKSGKLRAIRWVGHRRCAARPIRFHANCVAPRVPSQDVLLSPDHAVLIGDVLVNAHRLLNGISVTREPLAVVLFVHVELDRHDIMLAAGLECESFLDTGNRGQFDGEAGVRPMFYEVPADGLQATLEAYRERGYAPLSMDDETVWQAHQQIASRCRQKIVRIS